MSLERVFAEPRSLRRGSRFPGWEPALRTRATAALGNVTNSPGQAPEELAPASVREFAPTIDSGFAPTAVEGSH